MIPQRACSCTILNCHTSRPRIPGGLRCDHARKADLIDLGCWALRTGCAWLVVTVEVAIAREGLSNV